MTTQNRQQSNAIFLKIPSMKSTIHHGFPVTVILCPIASLDCCTFLILVQIQHWTVWRLCYSKKVSGPLLYLDTLTPHPQGIPSDTLYICAAYQFEPVSFAQLLLLLYVLIQKRTHKQNNLNSPRYKSYERCPFILVVQYNN